MSVIRPLAPPRCPRCKAEGSLFIDNDRLVTCKLCLYKQDMDEPEIDPGTPIDAAETLEERRRSYRVTGGIRSNEVIDRWAKTKYESALHYLNLGKWDEALDSMRKALEHNKNFVDAHIWIARISDDDEIRRKHYGEALALLPNDSEIVRELMVLNGQLSTEEAARSANAAYSPASISPDMAVAVDKVEIACSNCGSHDLTVENGQGICQTCGNTQSLGDNAAGYGMKSVVMELLKKRGQHIEWVVGEHILHCDNCGAERIMRKKMQSVCPFCGSTHVVESDALDSFEQPDGVVPFRVNEASARTALDETLNSNVERLKGDFHQQQSKAHRFYGSVHPLLVF